MKAIARARTGPGEGEATDAGPSDGSARPGPLPIGGLARAAGVSTRTVRYYEEIGLLRTARRFAGGRRVFDADALERMRFIGRLKRLGFSLEEIAELNEVFALQRSTAAMLQVLDDKLGLHLQALAEQVRELERVQADLRAYREHIRRRLAEPGTGPKAAAAPRPRAGRRPTQGSPRTP